MTKGLWAILAAVLLALGYAGGAHAQGYPKGTINLVIPLAPGDAADSTARLVGEELSKALGVPVNAVNRPGAGGALGVNSVVSAGKDGYTLLFTSNNALTFRRILDPQTATYDPARDLTTLGLAARTPILVAIGASLPYSDFASMVEYSKKNPGTVRIGTVGAGSIGDFSVGMINSLTGAGLTMVPFKGAAPAVTALLGGHVEGVALALGAVSRHLKSGAMKGIVTSAKFPEFPGIPTLPELGYKQRLVGVWFGFFAPAGLPAEATQALVPAIEKSVNNPDVAAKLLNLGIVREYQPPKAVLDEIDEEHKALARIAKDAGIVK
jgi:tripartite-type tricarboxylate transporter receptor subunit TctC